VFLPFCRRLDLNANQFSAVPTHALACAHSLTYLSFIECRLPSEARAQLRALADQGFMPRLRVLHLKWQEAERDSAGASLATAVRGAPAMLRRRAAERSLAAWAGVRLAGRAVLRLLSRGEHT
jgi:hypothetical protein